MLAAVVAGCLGPAPLGDPVLDAAGAAATPWERGLDHEAATPDGAPERSREVRRSEAAPPGAPPFAAFDAVIQAFMASHEIPAASVAVLRDGTLRYASGYGHLDVGATRPVGTDAMFRIASITKPMTAAVVAMLVEDGRMAWSDPVFCLPPEPAPGCLLPIAPHPSRPVQDARLADVQLIHLVQHRTGWVRADCSAPFFYGNPIAIAQDFGIASPPPAWRLAQWFLGTPMRFDPGGDPGEGLDPYCNMGYVILGLVAEAATGASLGALFEAYLFRPLQVSGDIEPGHTLPEHRNPREPFYACDGGTAPSIFEPAQEVCLADGAFDLDALLGAGGLVASAEAVGAIYEVFWNNGTVRDPLLITANGHTGGLPGTATTARRLGDGPHAALGDLQAVVLFNKRLGHDAAPFGTEAVYEFQLLHANLLAAFAAAEARSPAAAPSSQGRAGPGT